MTGNEFCDDKRYYSAKHVLKVRHTGRGLIVGDMPACSENRTSCIASPRSIDKAAGLLDSASFCEFVDFGNGQGYVCFSAATRSSSSSVYNP